MDRTAKYIPEPNDQRYDPTYDWGGVRITGSIQCMGNLFEDILNAIALEYNIPTLAPGNTKNYYAVFFGTLSEVLKKPPKRHHYFNTHFHCLALNLILRENRIPLTVRRKSTKNVKYALAKLEQTDRIIGLSVNAAVGRHMVRVNALRGHDIDVNDPYGKNPYKEDKKGGFKTYSLDELHRMGVNSVVWITRT